MPKTDKRKLLKTVLIDAAERIIAEKGWRAVRARALAEETGRALGAIYTVYPDLDALIMEVKARILEGIDATMTDATKVSAHSPLQQLLALADAYLDYAVREPRRWKTLFEHHLPEPAPFPDWYLLELAKLFAHVEAPLETIAPALPEHERKELGQALFSAVHGIVTLGLEGRLGESPREVIAGRIALLVCSCVAGLEGRSEVADKSPVC